jgi:hypothetical protein
MKEVKTTKIILDKIKNLGISKKKKKEKKGTKMWVTTTA